MAEHVLFVVNVYPPSVGGVQRLVQGLATELVRQGNRATVVTLGDEDSDSRESGVRVLRFRPSWGFGTVMSFPPAGLRRKLQRILSGAGVTVVSTHTRFFPMTWLGVRLARDLAVPVVHSEHGSNFVSGVSLPIALASRLVDVTFGASALRRSTLVLGDSEQVVDFVQRLSGVNAHVLYNAIDFDPSTRVPQPRRGDHRVVFIGRLVPGKGWDVTLDALTWLSENRPEISVTADFVGDGPDRTRLEALVAERGILDVTVHGHVDKDTVMRLLTNAVYVNPTTLSEGFQTTLIEALAVHAQIVTYEVPGTRVLLTDGAPVRLVDSADVAAWARAIADALEHPLPTYPVSRLRSWLWPARVHDYLARVGEAREIFGH